MRKQAYIACFQNIKVKVGEKLCVKCTGNLNFAAF